MNWELKGSNILHLYAQDAYVVGNEEGLLELRNAIDQALKTKQATASVSPTDGEGYETHIILVGEDEEDQFHKLKLPYTGKGIGRDMVFDIEGVNVNHPHILVKKN